MGLGLKLSNRPRRVDSFSLSDIADLARWFDANENVFTDVTAEIPATNNDLVGSWRCKQSNVLFTQSTISSRFTYKTSGFGTNSRPYIDGSATYRKLVDSGDALTLSSDFTAFVIVEQLDSFDNPVYAGEEALPILGNDFGLNLVGGSPDGLILDNNTYSLNTPVMLSNKMISGNLTNSKIYVDGVESTSVSKPYLLCGVPSKFQQFGGTCFGQDAFYLAEFALYTRELTSTELDSVHNYFKSKYGIS
jgi:hypothetical protein